MFGTQWVDINNGDETKPFYRSRLVVPEHTRQADWSFFTATPPLEALRSLLICATIDELPNEMRQPVAWREPADVRAEAGTGKSKVGRLPRSMYGCRDAGVNSRFARLRSRLDLCKVEHRRASTAIWRSSSVCGYSPTHNVSQPPTCSHELTNPMASSWDVTDLHQAGTKTSPR